MKRAEVFFHTTVAVVALAVLVAFYGSVQCQSGTIEYDQAKYAAIDSVEFIVLRERPKGADSVSAVSVVPNGVAAWTCNSSYRVITLNIHGEVRIFNTLVGVDTLAAIEVFGRHEPRPVGKKGRCPECNKLGWKSKVWGDVSSVSTPAIYIPPSWDEDGNFISDRADYVRHFHCTKGHEWTE